MATTAHLEITLLEQSQAQKEITINEAFARIDALLNSGVIDRDLATPPTTPAAGDVYIVAAAATGAWVGKGGSIAYFDQIWRFVTPREGMMLWVNDEDARVVYNGTSWVVVESSGGAGPSGTTDFPLVSEGRLTLSSGLAVTVADVTAATTLYFSPYKGSRIALYNGTAWDLKIFSELSMAVPATANTLYDVWAYNNSGAVALEATAWTNDTTRATALALQNGVWVKSGAPTRRYLGTFRTTGVSGQTEDSKAKRFLWNYHHRAQRPMASAVESTGSWNYSTTSWRQANANSANQLSFVIGIAEDTVRAQVPPITAYSSTTAYRSVAIGIGLDSTTTNSASFAVEGRCNTQVQALVSAVFEDVVAAGYHTLSWLERGGGTDVQSFNTTISTGNSTLRMCGGLFA